jgi:hypothetical protein
MIHVKQYIIYMCITNMNHYHKYIRSRHTFTVRVGCYNMNEENNEQDPPNTIEKSTTTTCTHMDILQILAPTTRKHMCMQSILLASKYYKRNMTHEYDTMETFGKHR